MTEIVKFCSRHQLHLISDEVYASCIFDSGNPDAVPFTSVLSLDLPALIDPNLVHLLYGFSKVVLLAFHHSMFKLIIIGLCIWWPPSRIPDFPERGASSCLSGYSVCLPPVQLNLKVHTNSTQTPTQHLHRRRNNRRNDPRRQTIRLRFLRQIQPASHLDIQDHHFDPGKGGYQLCQGRVSISSSLDYGQLFTYHNRNAGFFIYIDLSPYLALLPDIINGINGISKAESTYEYALAQKFLDAGIFLHPGEEHGKKPGWFRLVFSHEEEVLEEGLRR